MESKIIATHRLQREGRWDEATAYRDEVRTVEKAESKTRTEAKEVAWTAMLEKLPPLESQAEAGQADDFDGYDMPDIPPDVLNEPTDLIRHTLWVYERLWCKSPPTGEIPSAGALGLWRWAKSNSDRFYEQLLPKALKERPAETTNGVVEDMGIEEIERMLGPDGLGD